MWVGPQVAIREKNSDQLAVLQLKVKVIFNGSFSDLTQMSLLLLFFLRALQLLLAKQFLGTQLHLGREWQMWIKVNEPLYHNDFDRK